VSSYIGAPFSPAIDVFAQLSTEELRLERNRRWRRWLQLRELVEDLAPLDVLPRQGLEGGSAY